MSQSLEPMSSNGTILHVSNRVFSRICGIILHVHVLDIQNKVAPGLGVPTTVFWNPRQVLIAIGGIVVTASTPHSVG